MTSVGKRTPTNCPGIVSGRLRVPVLGADQAAFQQTLNVFAESLTIHTILTKALQST
jgi:hypothetical protein